MRKSACLFSRWFAALLALAILAGFLTACGNSSPSEGDRESVTMAPVPTSTAIPAEAAATPGASALPVVAAQAPAPGENGSTSNAETNRLRAQPGNGSLTAAVSSDAEALLAAFEEVLSDIYESALPSVVYIRVPNPTAASLQRFQNVPDELLWGTGSGFVWDAEGHIVTNHHVVEEVTGTSEEVTVIFADSTQATGQVIGSDPHSDLAVIKLSGGDRNLQPVTLADSSPVKVGQFAVAIGAPFGQEFTMTSGIVSAVGRNISGQGQFTIPEVIQTDAAINPGNSGGPLLDRQGQVIGINTQIISRSGNFSGVGMAVPVNIAKRVVPLLIENGEFDYPWLGVSVSTVSSSYVEELDLPTGTTGALIVTVVEGSPADEAGLRGADSSLELDGMEHPAGGDIIVAINTQQVTGSSDLIANLVYHNRPRDEITLMVLRDGQREKIEVTLGQRPTRP